MQKLFATFLSLIIFIVFLLAGCTVKKIEDAPTAPGNLEKINSCEGCHTNYDQLKADFNPDPPAPPGHGCGGAPPHYEPYDRVYLGGSGYETFKNDIHGKLGCVTCHNGVDGTADKELAHSGNFTKEPSHIAKEKCASCHPTIVQRAENSLHQQGWGQKMMLIKRGGYGNKPSDFNKCPEEMREGYSKNCFTCHGTCGECHVIRPKVKGGGLTNGHAFIKTPDMIEVCVGCHVSRGGHAYLGVAPGTKPDVHLTKMGFKCINCHSMDEVHGDGKVYDTRFKMPALPKCENCHSDLENKNKYHKTHISDFNCQTCHSQIYNNCGSCHIGTSDGARIPSHMKFKIAVNPIPDIKTKYKLATVREALSAPDSWEHYGVPVLANFDAAPTYKYTTPHNILKWTERTDTTNLPSTENDEVTHPTCAQGCHIIKQKDGTYRNKEYYLFNTDLNDWELGADRNIVMDGRLPAWWKVE